MKLSVSLSEEDVAILDAYIEKKQLASRSAGLQRAVQLLRHPDLETNYAEAWREWDADEDAQAWDGISGDGLTDAAR